MENKTLMTDFYELTMAQTYFDQGKQGEEVYFDIFFRKNPFNGGYTISGGLEETINYIKNFNFNKEEIIEAIKFVNFYHKKIYLTVNTLLFNDEIDECLEYIKFLHENDIDDIIMQDIVLIEIVNSKFPDLEIHASTQCHNHNIENINFMKSLGVKRVILAR